MRPRIVALLLCALVLAVMSGGCKFAGVSAVYMSIDAAGAQRRDVFFPDSVSAYCITKFSSAKADATVDFTVYQTADAMGNPISPPSTFAVDEETPGAGTETVVSYDIPQQGIMITISCNGECVEHGIGCPDGYTDEGKGSCGPDADCCYAPFAMTMAQTSAIPYPVGSYQCVVDVNGEPAGVTDFTIQFPSVTNGAGTDCPVPPPFNGVICEGWVLNGTTCPGFTPGTMCTCDGTAWNCPQ
jgi:hypothetical protein